MIKQSLKIPTCVTMNMKDPESPCRERAVKFKIIIATQNPVSGHFNETAASNMLSRKAAKIYSSYMTSV